MQPLLKLSNIKRNYGAIKALRGANFEIMPGEVMGLFGENGAGKSTMVKIISGFDSGFEGEYLLNGEQLHFTSPFQAERAGIAVEVTMLAKMRNLGEACTAANRIYVLKNIADEFTTKLTQAMGSLKVGNELDPDVNVGPLLNASTRDKASEFVDDAISKGAKLHVGGKVPCGKKYFYPPTVLSNVPKTANCVNDEIFGPVAAIQTFDNLDAVIESANDTEYGLVAYVFTENMKLGMSVCEILDYGMVGLNRGLISYPAAPFGGTKQSGLGREGGHEGMLEFTETLYISASW